MDLKAIAEFRPEAAERTYSQDSFRPLLPEDPTVVGKPWRLPPGSVQPFLAQFHSSASEHMNIDANGCYAVVRAVSGDYVDVRIRAHGQYQLTPQSYLSPAQFSGQLLFNRATDQVVFFVLSVPTDNILNVAFEVLKEDMKVGMLFTPEFKLQGGRLPESIQWSKELPESDALALLQKQFYAFEQLKWLPLEEAVKRSEETRKPLFVVAIAGVLDDQSC